MSFVSTGRSSERRQWFTYLFVALTGYGIGCFTPGSFLEAAGAAVKRLPGRLLSEQSIDESDTINLNHDTSVSETENDGNETMGNEDANEVCPF